MTQYKIGLDEIVKKIPSRFFALWCLGGEVSLATKTQMHQGSPSLLAKTALDTVKLINIYRVQVLKDFWTVIAVNRINYKENISKPS